MSVTTKVINLGELRRDDEFPAYAAVYSTAASNPHVLSPRAMWWTSRIHLNHLQPCRQFWLTQKKKLRCKLGELFAPLLREHYGEDYLAVLGDHPWPCLLYLNYQLEHGAHGLYFLHSRLDQNIYKNIDWQHWFAPQSVLAEHWSKLNPKGFTLPELSKRQAQLSRFIERMDLGKPQDLHAAEQQSMTRRFGQWIGRIWRWTFGRQHDLHGFPWCQLKSPGLPCVERDLEYPVNQWAYIEVLLREDLARLAERMSRNDCEHINQMRWHITLFNHHKITVELSFRHPYALHRDLPDFNTALYQARYLFDALMRDLQTRESDLDLPECMPFLAWRLEISERVMLTPELMQLFAQASDEIDYARLLELQNKLPLAFESYRASPCFYPETSFQHSVIGSCPQYDFDMTQWLGSGINKPLFFYPEAQLIEDPDKLQKIFLERNSNPWWLCDDLLQSLRDYFILKDARGRCSWGYRDAAGNWFKQGEFC